MEKPILILVGAGPGDPELITVKGLKAIRNADVILYDSLVNTKIFDLAFDDLTQRPEMIFVGKRRGLKENPQEKINDLILEKLNEGKNVLRLKGGDPFIFARGVEEVEHANQAGFKAEIIPGLSSGLSVPVASGTTLTLREKSDAVTLVTAHDFSYEKLQHWAEILRHGSTLVVYMGLFRVVEITDGLMKYLPANFPAIAIQDGSLESEKIIKSDLSSLAQALIDEAAKSPVILVFGAHIARELELVDKNGLICSTMFSNHAKQYAD